MERILDLSLFTQETLDIKLPDGKMIHIAKPSREQVIKIAELKQLKESSKPAVVQDRLDSLVLDILNGNDAGEVYTRDYIDNTLNVRMRVAVITAYAAWIGDIESDPN